MGKYIKLWVTWRGEPLVGEENEPDFSENVLEHGEQSGNNIDETHEYKASDENSDFSYKDGEPGD